ncbi:MAG: anthranilate phosphoribosyltransferase [Promethearchaeota archaeon]
MPQITIIEGIKKVMKQIALTEQEAAEIMEQIMNGKTTNVQLAAFLTALSMKGETIEEITGFARIMRKFAINIHPQIRRNLLDTCGTGGDSVKTFNISTITALIVAATGVFVAKHGNRAITSKCGSADLLEALGVNITIEPVLVKECLESIGLGFMFAPLFHPAMKHAMPTRKELKIRTVFNILGPLTNPANAKCYVLGVYDKDLAPVLASVLKNLGAHHVFTIYNSHGIDELAPVGINYISEYYNGTLETYALTNEDFSIPRCSLHEVVVDSREENVKIAIGILKNKIKGAKFNTVLMNSALALKCAGKASDLQEGVSIAKNTVESGRAYEKLLQFIKFSGGNEEKINKIT